MRYHSRVAWDAYMQWQLQKPMMIGLLDAVFELTRCLREKLSRKEAS